MLWKQLHCYAENAIEYWAKEDVSEDVKDILKLRLTGYMDDLYICIKK